MIDPIIRLRSAVARCQPVMFDQDEADLLLAHIADLEAALVAEKQKHDKLLTQAFRDAQEHSGLMLKAVLAGAVVGSRKVSEQLPLDVDR